MAIRWLCIVPAGKFYLFLQMFLHCFSEFSEFSTALGDCGFIKPHTLKCLIIGEYKINGGSGKLLGFNNQGGAKIIGGGGGGVT